MSNIWKCDCGRKFGNFPDKNIVEVYYPNGQEIEIGYNYINFVCGGCGKKYFIESSIVYDLAGTNAKKVKKSKPSKVFDKKAYAHLKSIKDFTIPDSRGIFPNVNTNIYKISQYDRNNLLRQLDGHQKQVFRCLTESIFDIKSISTSTGLPEEICQKHIKTITEQILKLNKQPEDRI